MASEDKSKPNFALLISKKLDQKDKKSPMSSDSDSPIDPGEEEMESSDEEMPEGDGERMQDSAVADLLHAIRSSNIPAAKQALKDFIDLNSSAPSSSGSDIEGE